MQKYETLLETRKIWLADRPVMQAHNRSLSTTTHQLKNEVSEAVEALENEDLPEYRRELADVGWFLLSAMEMAGGDLYTEMQEKHAYNMLRYRPRDFQTGEYATGHKKTKELEREYNMKSEFYAEF